MCAAAPLNSPENMMVSLLTWITHAGSDVVKTVRSWEGIWPKNLELKRDNQSWLLALADVCAPGVKIEQKELEKKGIKSPDDIDQCIP